MATRQPLVAGNWKLHGNRQSAVELAGAVVAGAADIRCDVLVCPTAVHLGDVQGALDGSEVLLGAQNCAAAEGGAFTGEVAASMLREFGCSHVIVGHSERRQLFGESDQDIAAKTLVVLQSGLIPIVCVGETLDEREAGQVDKVIARQLDVVTDLIGIEQLANAVIAYEPVWAIGTGKTASPEQAQDVHAVIRQRIAAQSASIADTLRILYGGSVKPGNAAELFSQTDIDGGLIGGASLDADAFLAICSAAA